jgi:hypothetical protein
MIMKKIFFIIAIVLISFIISIPARTEESTKEDRERIIKLEEGQKSIEIQIARLEEGQKSIQKQIDNLMTIMLWGFGILFGSTLALVGFVIWDRRTALEPAIKRNEKLEKVLSRRAGFRFINIF